MIDPESERASQEAERIHRERLNTLISLGVYESILQNAKPLQVDGETLTGLGINSEFRGEPVVQLLLTRSKQGAKLFYAEHVELTFDGTVLTVKGAHPIYTGEIPTDKNDRDRLLARVLTAAFENPRRKIVDPRKIL